MPAAPNHRPIGIVWAALLVLLAGCSKETQSPPHTASPPDAAHTRTLTLLTWNVKADPARDELRYPALCEILGQANADIIALNEVRPAFLNALTTQPWFKGKHYVTLHADEAGWLRGDFLVSRFPFEKHSAIALPSRTNRGAVIAWLRVAGRTLAVATSHMESPLEAGDVRARQLDRLFVELAGADDAVLMGDCNFGNGAQPETGRLNKSYVDLWPVLRPGEPGLTWDMERNPLARDWSFPAETSRRLDRILLRSPLWRAKSIRLIGDAPIPGVSGGPLFPSDHYGLLATVERD